MNSLVGGKQLVFNCLVYANGRSIPLSVMVDTGANGYAFMNRKTARMARKLLNLTHTELPKPIPVTGFDDNQKHQLTHVTKAHLCIDRRNESEVPFLELDIGAHDIILGRK